MATQTVEFQASSGLTLTLKLFSKGVDTVVQTASAAERTNDKGTYRAAFTDVPAGVYRAKAIDASGAAASTGYVALLAGTATYIVEECDLNAVADRVLGRSIENVEATADDKHTLAALIGQATNAEENAGTLTVKKPSDDSPWFTFTVVASPTAKPITEIS